MRDVIRQLKKKGITARSSYPAQLKICLSTGDKTFSTLVEAQPTLQELGIKMPIGDREALEEEVSKTLWQTWTGGRHRVNQASLSGTDVRALFSK